MIEYGFKRNIILSGTSLFLWMAQAISLTKKEKLY